MVAVRPLRVEELAELLAFEFDAARGGIPKYRETWRLNDQTQAVLSTCSSLVTIVYDSADAEFDINSDADSDTNSDASSARVLPIPYVLDSNWTRQSQQYNHLLGVVQFSHFSVKEFLISNRLGGFSQYHIRPASAHTILTQACLGCLLHLDIHTDKNVVECFPLSQYAARHWVEHAHFEDVASRVKDGMETLFDPDKPHLAAWIRINDMDSYLWRFSWRFSDSVTPNPLYYSVLCGFYDLVKHLATKYPQHLNAIYGQYRYPLFAALRVDRLEFAELLLEHGADVNARETTGETILLNVLSQLCPRPRPTLLGPHHLVKYERVVEVAQMLVRHNADTNSQDDDGKTPLHLLSESQINKADILTLALLLLKHGAKLNTRDKDNQTPLHLAVRRCRSKLAVILLEHGADATAEDNKVRTILHALLSESRNDNEGDVIDLAMLLLKHGAGVNKRDKINHTPLHLAVRRDRSKLAAILLEHGADATAEDNNGRSLLHTLLSESWNNDEGDVISLALLLLEHGAELNTRDKHNQTPLHLAVMRNWTKLAAILLEHGADATAKDNNGRTVFHTLLSERRKDGEGDVINLALLLLIYGAGVNRQDKDNESPLHLALRRDRRSLSKLPMTLLEHGADVKAEDNDGNTPLSMLVERLATIHGTCGLSHFLKHKTAEPAHDTKVSRQYKDKKTPVLTGDASMENKTSETPVHQVIRRQNDTRDFSVGFSQPISPEHGMDINGRPAQDESHLTLSHLQSNFSPAQSVQTLLDLGANPNGWGGTPLSKGLKGKYH